MKQEVRGLWIYRVFLFFMEIFYKNYLIKEDGSVLLDNNILPTKQLKFGETIIKIDFLNYRLERFLAEAIFKLSEYEMLFLECGHINLFKGDNSFSNIKVYSRQDKKNKSGKYVALHNGQPYLFLIRKPIEPVYDILKALGI